MNQPIISVILLIACLLIAPLATASEADFQQGKQAYIKKDYAAAYKALKKAADNNHAEAQLWLASMYASDKFGLKADYKKSNELYKKAADNGNAAAAYRIAYLRSSDFALAWDNEDLSDAIVLYEKAAKLGHVKAQEWLADVHSPERKFHGDLKKHVYWMQKSAENGSRDAQFKLAEIYLEGKGLKKSESAAFKWLEKSAKRGHVRAQIEMAKVYLGGHLGKTKDPKLGIQWLKLAAKNGSAEAFMVLGMMHVAGDNVEKDPKLGLKFLREATKLNHVPAMFKIGELYALGVFTGKTEVIRALTWMHVADIKGHPQAKKAKAFIKRKYGYKPADLASAELKASNCIKTNYGSCDYDGSVLHDFNKQLLDGVMQRAKERNQQK